MTENSFWSFPCARKKKNRGLQGAVSLATKNFAMCFMNLDWKNGSLHNTRLNRKILVLNSTVTESLKSRQDTSLMAEKTRTWRR